MNAGDIVTMSAAGPTGGTFTVTYRHGTSDPIPFSAAAGKVKYATGQAEARDAIIQAEHDAAPELAAACRICTPVPVDTSEYFAPDTWRDRVGRVIWRAQRVWWAITADDGADWYSDE